MIKIKFKSGDHFLAGNLYVPSNIKEGKIYPAIIIAGSWTTVKEQMAALYAKKFSEKGYFALAFDFRNYGGSQGEPRYMEQPHKKVEDIKSAVSYLLMLRQVDTERISVFGVCAGAMYALMAAATDSRINIVATAASWLQDADAAKLLHGGEDGVAQKRRQAQEALRIYQDTGEMIYIPTISTTDCTAAMFGEYDYYLNPDRGRIDEWSHDKFALASWEEWLTLDTMPFARQIEKPLIMIHSDGCILPEHTLRFFDDVISPTKELKWLNKKSKKSHDHQANFYDQDYEVNYVIKTTTLFLRDAAQS